MSIETTISEWKNHKKLDFTVGGRESYIVCPENPRPDKRWVWRAEFFGAFDTVDMALLNDGWYLAYHRVSDLYGCPESLKMMNEFQTAVEREFGLNPRTVLFGFSRGGLYSVNYAVAYPDKVALLYLDAPVLDIRSWPGGKGAGSGSPSEWLDCMRIYSLDEESAKTFAKNPIDRAEELAKDDIPVVIVAGAADHAVPIAENSYPFEKRFRAAGGTLKLIVKPNCDHHPHSLDDPEPVVEFIEKHFA